jgi:hypothetical protein
MNSLTADHRVGCEMSVYISPNQSELPQRDGVLDAIVLPGVAGKSTMQPTDISDIRRSSHSL